MDRENMYKTLWMFLGSVGTLGGWLASTLVLHAELHHLLHLHKLIVIVLRGRHVVVQRRLLLLLLLLNLFGVVSHILLLLLLRLLHVIHLLFEHLQAAGSSIRHHVGETIERRLFEAAFPLGSKFHRIRLDGSRLQILLEWDRRKSFFRARRHDRRRLGLGFFFGNRRKGQHGASILTKHLRSQVGFVPKEKFMVVSSQFRAARDTRKVPVN